MNFKKEFLKYLKHWPWFVVSLLLFMTAAYYYIGQISPTYETSALINLDINKDKEAKIINTISATDGNLDGLEKEKMYINSNAFLSKIVNDLNLNINYFEKGPIQNKVLYDVPFVVKPTMSNDSLPQLKYNVEIVKDGFVVIDASTEKTYLINSNTSLDNNVGIPFKIELTTLAEKNLQNYLGKDYVVTIESTQKAVNNLKLNLNIISFASPNTNLLLIHKGINPVLSKKILDKILVTLDKDIVVNKQKKFEKTVTYLSSLIAALTTEKDSLKRVKENYLSTNNIYVLDQYITSKTSEKSTATANSLSNQRQIDLTTNAINDIKSSSSTSTLGTDYSLNAQSVNRMLQDYNTNLMQSELLLQRAQKNNPAYLALVSQLKVQKQAILGALNDYLNQLNQTNTVNRIEQSNAVAAAKSIPKKDKELGEINDKLSLKEASYNVLLQKREETILNSAVVESNLSILDSPQTNFGTGSPQPKSFMLGAFMFGLLLPFGIIYVSALMDTKVHNEEDIQKIIPNVPQLGYIPKIDTKEKLDNSATSRSIIAEATRTLVSNISYLLPEKIDNKGNVILFTSSIQGEGKSFCAFHSAVSISNHNKKVLLIGADLRNPQLHEYFSLDKNVIGLTHYLSYKSDDWKGFLKRDANFSNNIDVLFAGEIPPNPTQLITNLSFDKLIEEAKSLYDFIILDTAPVQMVSDTLNLSHLADVTVYVVKYDYTDKSSIVQINNFIKKDQLKNVGILINGVNMKDGYAYGYGNYGNYQYQEAKVKKPWYKLG